MSDSTQKQAWDAYKERELKHVAPLLAQLGFLLEKQQAHISGERFLMSGNKLVLTGTSNNPETKHRRVIIKVSSDKRGITEIKHERVCRQTLHKLKFAAQTLLSPAEILYTEKDGFVIIVTDYIEQNSPFLRRPLKEQFLLSLKMFKMQESVHAATYAHAKVIRRVFGMWNAQSYLDSFQSLKDSTMQHNPEDKALSEVTQKASTLLSDHKIDIERYSGFLTHEDFALHNLRIRGQDIYLIDHSSLRFGNKHESWARFMNFMLLYNLPLEKALVQYVKDNRSPEENLSLRLMRIYKVGQLLEYHACAASRSSGNLEKLSHKRVRFWTSVLDSLLADKSISEEIIYDYKRDRDALRTDEEKQRQKELQQLPIIDNIKRLP